MTATLAHDKISPTAKMVAYWRQYADLPFSDDIAQEFKAEEAVKQIFGSLPMPSKEFFVPLVEIRYNCIRDYILKNSFKQVLEFASGVSLRGLAMTKDPQMVYVETDLDNITDEKTRLIQKIQTKHGISERKNLFFHSTNILNYEEIKPAIAHFDRTKPLLIANEGLFQYLNKDEKKTAAKHIHKILSEFNGTWITPDFDTWSKIDPAFERPGFKEMMEAVNSKTGRSFEANAFKDENEVFSFFEELGFKVSYQPQWNAETPVSSLPKNPPSELLTALKRLRLWVLKPANH